MTTARQLEFYVRDNREVPRTLASRAAAELNALTKERDRLRKACQRALDWCTGEGMYSCENDTAFNLAEEVAPELEAALKGQQ